MTVLVTGASGHLGNNVVRALSERGRKVRALVHASSASLDGLDVERVRGDVLDRGSLDGAFQGVEVAYHCAALVSISPSDGRRVLQTNVLGPRNVVDACLAHRVLRLVHVSSVHALAKPGPSGVTDESCGPSLDPKAPAYDRSKAAGEEEIRAGIRRGLDAVTVNPTGIIGPHDYAPRRAGRALITMYRGRLPMNIAGGFNWVDVRDVAAGALAAEARGRTGERYLLSGHWASMPEVAALMRACTGRAGPRLVAPLWLARLALPFLSAWAKLTGSEPLYTGPSLRALTEHRACSSAKAEAELGFASRPLAQTIADTFAFYGRAGLL
jgi:nucleoside-diphosphate-sugar epimerase